MKVKKYIEQEIELDIEGVTLLSAEEARKLPKDILSCGYGWWLRSPAYRSSHADIVRCNGFIDEYGHYVDHDLGAVRPAFIISNLQSENLKIGDKIQIMGVDVTIISRKMALADNPVGHTYFRADCEASDANDYNVSDVKKWLEDWWNLVK